MLAEVYGYNHHQSSCECAARALASDATRLLQQSGSHGIFIRRLKRVGHDKDDAVILWVPITTVDELQARIQPLAGIQGLAVNRQGLGVRVVGSGDELAQARAVLQPGKVAQSAAKIRGELHYEVSGLPVKTEADDVQALLSTAVQAQSWTPWSVRPLRSFVHKGHRTWVVAADTEPAKEKLSTSTGTVLFEKLATPQEVHQRLLDQKQALKVERRKYDPVKFTAPSSSQAPASTEGVAKQAPQHDDSELKKYVDRRFAAIKGDLDSQAKKINSLKDDFVGLQHTVKDSLSNVATKDDIAQMMHTLLADKRQKTTSSA